MLTIPPIRVMPILFGTRKPVAPQRKPPTPTVMRQAGRGGVR